VDRADRLSRLAGGAFDLLVVGGGITGAGIARDAAMRGLTVALVEGDDFAAGTSSRSSRLVHGGVRYLEHGHLGLVFEASRERRTLLRIAPHLVRPLAFTWPVYRGARIQRWTLEAGLTLYDALALFQNVGGHKRLAADVLRAEEPLLERRGLVGGARYWDAATSDTRLTLATIRSAEGHGATCLNHCAVVGARRAGGRVTGVEVEDRLTGQRLDVTAALVVVAAGPWTDALSTTLGFGAAGPAVRGSKGVHIAVPAEVVGNMGALTLLHPRDGRVFFVLPAGPFTIIGTTETPAAAGPEAIRADEHDVGYLLDATRAFFPHVRCTRDDVVSAWAGIRPLAAPHATGDAGRASREHTIARPAPGVLAVTGGKLTTYRAMAADVVDAALDALGRSAPRAATHREPLPGGDVDGLAVEVSRAAQAGFTPEVAEHLVHAHGSEWPRVAALVHAEPALGDEIEPGRPPLLAEVVRAARDEQAATLADVLVRRTWIAFETRDHGRSAARRIAPLLGRALGWSADRTAAEVTRYDAEATRLFGIDPA
jgi:glycerol-3-phosphate dehydrogenase